MEWYHEVLAALAVFALVASWRLPRCRIWVAVLTFSYLVSVFYYRAFPNPVGHQPHGAFIAFGCDALAFVIIRELHKERWEIWGLGSIMFACMTLNFVQMGAVVFGWPPVLPQWLYSSILELANAVYLLLIGGTGIMGLVSNASPHRHNVFRNHLGGMVPIVDSTYEKLTERSQAKQSLGKW